VWPLTTPMPAVSDVRRLVEAQMGAGHTDNLGLAPWPTRRVTQKTPSLKPLTCGNVPVAEFCISLPASTCHP
jgi:hypothetical protein